MTRWVRAAKSRPCVSLDRLPRQCSSRGGNVSGNVCGGLRLDRKLEPGVVVTIEPGFYRVEHLFTGDASLLDAVDPVALSHHGDVRGIRIEDDVLITGTGNEVLSAGIPKERHDVEAACAASAS